MKINNNCNTLSSSTVKIYSVGNMDQLYYKITEFIERGENLSEKICFKAPTSSDHKESYAWRAEAELLLDQLIIDPKITIETFKFVVDTGAIVSDLYLVGYLDLMNQHNKTGFIVPLFEEDSKHLKAKTEYECTPFVNINGPIESSYQTYFDDLKKQALDFLSICDSLRYEYKSTYSQREKEDIFYSFQEVIEFRQKYITLVINKCNYLSKLLYELDQNSENVDSSKILEKIHDASKNLQAVLTGFKSSAQSQVSDYCVQKKIQSKKANNSTDASLFYDEVRNSTSFKKDKSISADFMCQAGKKFSNPALVIGHLCREAKIFQLIAKNFNEKEADTFACIVDKMLDRGEFDQVRSLLRERESFYPELYNQNSIIEKDNTSLNKLKTVLANFTSIFIREGSISYKISKTTYFEEIKNKITDLQKQVYSFEVKIGDFLRQVCYQKAMKTSCTRKYLSSINEIEGGSDKKLILTRIIQDMRRCDQTVLDFNQFISSIQGEVKNLEIRFSLLDKETTGKFYRLLLKEPEPYEEIWVNYGDFRYPLTEETYKNELSEYSKEIYRHLTDFEKNFDEICDDFYSKIEKLGINVIKASKDCEKDSYDFSFLNANYSELIKPKDHTTGKIDADFICQTDKEYSEPVPVIGQLCRKSEILRLITKDFDNKEEDTITCIIGEMLNEGEFPQVRSLLEEREKSFPALYNTSIQNNMDYSALERYEEISKKVQDLLKDKKIFDDRRGGRRAFAIFETGMKNVKNEFEKRKIELDVFIAQVKLQKESLIKSCIIERSSIVDKSQRRFGLNNDLETRDIILIIKKCDQRMEALNEVFRLIQKQKPNLDIRISLFIHRINAMSLGEPRAKKRCDNYSGFASPPKCYLVQATTEELYNHYKNEIGIYLNWIKSVLQSHDLGFQNLKDQGFLEASKKLDAGDEFLEFMRHSERSKRSLKKGDFAYVGVSEYPDDEFSGSGNGLASLNGNRPSYFDDIEASGVQIYDEFSGSGNGLDDNKNTYLDGNEKISDKMNSFFFAEKANVTEISESTESIPKYELPVHSQGSKLVPPLSGFFRFMIDSMSGAMEFIKRSVNNISIPTKVPMFNNAEDISNIHTECDISESGKFLCSEVTRHNSQFISSDIPSSMNFEDSTENRFHVIQDEGLPSNGSGIAENIVFYRGRTYPRLTDPNAILNMTDQNYLDNNLIFARWLIFYVFKSFNFFNSIFSGKNNNNSQSTIDANEEIKDDFSVCGEGNTEFFLDSEIEDYNQPSESSKRAVWEGGKLLFQSTHNNYSLDNSTNFCCQAREPDQQELSNTCERMGGLNSCIGSPATNLTNPSYHQVKARNFYRGNVN